MSTALLQTNSELRERITAFDWASTHLGPAASWPQSLKTTVDVIVGSTQPMFTAWGPDLTFIYNDAYAPILGDKHPQALGRPIRDVWADIWNDIWPLIERALAGQSTWSENLHLVMDRNGDPEDTWYSFSYSPVHGEDGSVAGMFCACTETTAQVLAERQSTAERSRLFEMTRDLFAVATFDGYFRTVNAAWSRILGRPEDELLSRPFVEIIHPDDLELTSEVVATLQRGEPVHQFQVRLLKADGAPVTFAWSAVPERAAGTNVFYTVGRDITDDLRREEALRQSQKMEAVGQLTGGLAHDFNNLLQAVSGNLDLIRRRPSEPDRVARWAGNGLLAAERGSKLTAQLLAFSRSQQLELRPVEIAPLLLGMEDMLRRSIGPLVRISIKPGSPGLAALVDATQLEMAMLNLAINARDAMPGGGELSISASTEVVAEDAELRSGTYTVIRVSDEGTGMSPKTAARAFEPFFTTKGVGQGTGLGLSQVYGMARQAGGTARIEPRSPKGSTVVLLLPEIAVERSEPPMEAPPKGIDPSPSPSILVVDDDPEVREFLADSLDGLGFEVATADSGDAALVSLTNAMPDLLLVDFAMPGMTGAELAEQARQLNASLPVVFATGYADTSAMARISGDAAAVLRKPFDVSELEAVIRAALT